MSSITSLIDAIKKNDLLTVKSLIQSGTCDVNVQNSDGFTPLHTAVKNCNIEIVRYIINRKECHVNIKNRRGYTPLHIAVQKGSIEIVRCIIEHTARHVNIQDSRGDTPLHIAVQEGNIDIIKCLIENTACHVNIQDSEGYTPLHTAVQKGSIAIVRCIIEHTARHVNMKDNRGKTPLHIAVHQGNIAIVRCIIEHTARHVNMKDNRGNTPLHIAVHQGNIEIVRCIIEKTTGDVNIKNLEGYSLFATTDGSKTLQKIAKCQNVELFHVLIQHNVDVLTNHVVNQLQLVKFILSENDFKSLWFFIQNGLYINSLTSSGENIVHLLAQFYIDYYLYTDFRFLFYCGLDFNLINNVGNSPLMVASLLNNSPFIQFLASLPSDVKIQSDVNRQNHQGHTALHLCVIGFTLIKEKLNLKEIDFIVKELCAREYYPRYLACIDTLLNLSADVNVQDISGKTVLMLVCMKNDRKLLERLLIHGADVNIVDNHGRSALQYIDLTNNVYDLTFFNLLLSHGCRQSFNQPCLNGNTIIQNVLKFTPLWKIDDIVNFIKFLVFKNVKLQLLTSDDGESFYGQLSLGEFSSESRHKLRQILYLSGGSFVQITQILDFEVEENYEVSLPEAVRENARGKFYLFANNLSLKEICRRVIRQNTGLAIHDRKSELLDFPTLTDFLMFKDIDSERFSLPVQLDSFIYDDDYNSYDLKTEIEDYSRYEDCKYFNLNYSSDDYTPLHRAVKGGNITIVRCLIEHSTCNVNIQDSDGYTPLHRAARGGNITILRCLIEHTDCNVNIQDRRGYTPLHLAVWEGNIEIVRCLIEHTTCDVNIQDSDGYTPLYRAVHQGNIEIVRCLIEHTTCDVNIQDNDGYTPLYRAVHQGNIEIVRCLIEHTTCDINIQDSDGYTPLHIAVKGGNITIIRCLIEHTDCNVNIQDSDGYTPLHTAVQKGNIDDDYNSYDLKKKIEDFLRYKDCKYFNLNYSSDGYTTLHRAVKGGNITIIRCLIEHTDCNVNIQDRRGYTPLHLAVWEGNIEIVRCLIEHTTCDINTQDSDGYTPLHLAVSESGVDIIRYLIEHTDCDINIQDSEGNTPLHLAVYTSNIDIIRCLIEHTYCNVNIQDRRGYTPLHLAVYTSNIDIIRCLIEHTDCNVSIQDRRGYTPLHLAVYTSNIDIIRCLIEHTDCNVNIQDSDGYTPLHIAVQEGKIKIVRCLIENKDCNINIQDSTCNTIIQNVLKFPLLWQIDHLVKFIKCLVFKNVNLQLLTSDDGEISYGQLSLEKFSSESRQELRQILYLSGGSFVQITQILDFEVEENYEASLPESSREKPREKFYLFANNLSLEKHCRRVIRQNTGLAIHDIFSKLDFPILTNFLMFKDIDSEPFLQPVF